MQPLYEAPGLPAYQLPAELARAYGGPLGFPERRLLANFVASIDGVVARHREDRSPGSAIGGDSEADRFVMGLLRACAEAVLVGAGTLRAAPGHRWTPDHVYPPGAAAFAELRRRLGLAPVPRLVVVSGRGELDPAHAGLEGGALVLAGAAGARLRGRLPAGSALVVLGDRAELDGARMLDALRAEGHRVVLTEGGPHLLGSLLRAGAPDELFLTLSPRLIGRGGPGPARLGLVEGGRLGLDRPLPARLLSLRRHGSHLFLRYELGSGTAG
ncbi:MAG TPA: dihydrofolate reductase family protein [Candidatus Dormibacteraeota bacterium]|nr:dihydrofolate reductase family protein [Candidatus Dormibacteraeota bacterium]